MDLRGQFVETKQVKSGSVTTKLKPKYKHMVLVLDTVEAKMEYEKVHALDSMGAMGWCLYDDVKNCLGEVAAKKVIKFVEDKISKEAKKLK